MMPRVLLYCLIGGLPLTIAAAGAGHAAWWWLSGIVMATALVPVALYGPRGLFAQFGVIAPAVFIISVVCIWSEAILFMPQVRQDALSGFIGSTVMYLLLAAALAMLARALRLTRDADHVVHRRPALVTTGIVIACGFAYALYYLVFGAITYQYFTRGFYPDAPQQVAQLGGWFWVIQIGRGILMTMAVLPIVYTLRMARGPAALVVGAIAWVAGGLAPLLVPNDLMGTTQRIIHIVEIFTQNALLGVTVVLLLRPRSRTNTLRTTSPIPVV
jgi:hypothetical protein